MRANDSAACAALYAARLKDVKVTDASVTDAHYLSSGNISSGWGVWQATTVPKPVGAPTTEVESDSLRVILPDALSLGVTETELGTSDRRARIAGLPVERGRLYGVLVGRAAFRIHGSET